MGFNENLKLLLAGRATPICYGEPWINIYGDKLNDSMYRLSENEYTFVLDVIKAMKERLGRR